MNVFPIAFMDGTHVLNAAITNIPGSASLPLEVVANLSPKAAHAIDYIDTTGDFIGVYTGTVGNEILKCIIGGGMPYRFWIVIPATSRVSLRSMTPTPITNGSISMIFLGMGFV